MIATQWAAYCDAGVRALAGTQDTPRYTTLHDTEARPSPPGPYVVYEVGESSTTSRSGGKTAGTFRQYETVPVTFRVHAKTKETAVALAKIVATAFDPDREICLTDDAWVLTHRIGDMGTREGDTEWSWMLSYEFLLDATYDMPG